MDRPQIFLIHWQAAEAEDLAQALRAQGWRVALEAEDGARAVKAIEAQPPQAIVIYHTRLPSHGRHSAPHRGR